MFAIPFIQSYKEAGFSASDRAALLNQDLRTFHHAVTDRNRTRLLTFASEDYLEAYKDVLRSESRDEKIVDSKIDFVNLSEDAYSAQVDVYIKYFRQPYYVVKERLVKEEWKFSVSSGWKLSGYKTAEEDVAKR